MQQQEILSQLDAFTGFARSKLGASDLAAEAVQQSLLKAMESSSQLRDEDKVIPWFYTILRRTIVDLHRSRESERKSLERYGDEAGTPVAEIEIDEDSICACLRSLLPSLRRQYAELIERLDLSGEDPSEVAEALGITSNNLKVRRHRARKQLREKLEELCGVCATHGCLDCSCQQTNTPRGE